MSRRVLRRCVVALVVPADLLAVPADCHGAPAGTVGPAPVQQEEPAFIFRAGPEPAGKLHLDARPGQHQFDGETGFALADQCPLQTVRRRFTGVLHTWGFALYLASRDGYQDNYLPTGLPFGSPEECLDAGGRYLDTPA
jgi:hypothetical protein